MTYSLDFRQKVLAMKKKHNWTFEKTSEHFEIPIRTIFRWNKRIEAYIKHRDHKSKIDKDKLIEDVNKYPDSYQYERAKRMGVSRSCINSTLKKLKITYKKNFKPSEKR